MRGLAPPQRAKQRAQGFAAFSEWTGEGTEVRGWRLRTALEQLDANVFPPGVFVASHRLPRHAQTVAGRERHAVSAELSTPVADDEPPELGEASAPPTLASSVRFYCLLPLIDSSTTPASGASAATTSDILVVSPGGVLGLGVRL